MTDNVEKLNIIKFIDLYFSFGLPQLPSDNKSHIRETTHSCENIIQAYVMYVISSFVIWDSDILVFSTFTSYTVTYGNSQLLISKANLLMCYSA